MRWIKALVALALLTLLVSGPPVMLGVIVGNPWPAGGVSMDQPLTDEAIIGVLAALAWFLWAQLMVCIVVETAAAISNRGIDVRVPGAFGFQQNLARVLVTAVVLAIGSGTISTFSAAAATAATAPVPPAAAAPATKTPPVPPAGEQAPEVGDTITVQHGDTLWGLAEKHLGDGARFSQIASLNEGRPMTGGKVFRSSEAVQPGWELKMPATAATTPGRPKTEDTQVEVHSGDSLWGIAEDQYGDGANWSKIWEANKGERQVDGRTLSDPDMIQPGWNLTVPSKETSTPKRATSTPEQAQTPAVHEATPEAAPEVVQESAGEVASEAVGAGGSTGMTPSAQAASSGSSGSSEPAQHLDVVDDAGLPSWLMRGLAGGGALLAGSLLLGLRARRAGQHRSRRPGRSIAPTLPELMHAEKSVTVAGSSTIATVELVETVLVRLASSLAAQSVELPSLAAVEVTGAAVAVHLRTPATAPGVPWVISDDGLLWVVDTDVDLDLIGPHHPDSPAPWPLLVTIGQDDRDASWMLNLEDLNMVVTGDETAGVDFARFVAAEVACNPWSKHTALDVIGIAHEMAAVSPDRVTVHAEATSAAANAVAEAVSTIDRLAAAGIDTSTARARQDDADPWPSRMLIVDQAGDLAELEQLMELMKDHHGRTATAVLLPGAEQSRGFEIHIDERRQLTIPSVNLTVKAVGLTSAEAHGCAALLAQADSLADEAVPDLAGDQEWQPMADAMGSLRDQYTVSRSATTLEPAASVLPAADEEYTRAAATTVADLNAVAPKVTQTVREEVAAADPTLDADLQEWEADSCIRPRLTLLGPVVARTSGTALDRRRPFYTELFAYLATRPYGATTDEVATAFDLNAARVRTDVNKLRHWLGTDPVTGQKFLPAAREAPMAQERGTGVYQVVDALVDVDLFRRLRLRGESHGPAGIDDLERALRLITGRPFEKLRPGGWGWLLEGDRLDQHMVCAIADVAHVVVTHNLHAGDLERARTAASIAVTAAPDEEVTRLDLAAVLEARGHIGEAARVIRDEVCNRDDDGQACTELPARTEEILDAHQWARRAAM
ncbi:LysM peptidoglycan-binding domain-containing protein [Aeromicrobium sp. CFBP 8757]|uniref:LysM peptidoglycan-binding domain-containing protein n=1 Tax=Aeromicrobium sp. CFBP 8757 TaxID=2775288 RepID=UPI00177CEBB2|nr:LysM peptidoglycan-binding domain-containing protein [Aeromicrobium sp. CFBP 8757]MBD8605370.1 LysM peptidoglycan-binding domain-containing protein [Aeromicrobium sp. CFBP 8757]